MSVPRHIIACIVVVSFFFVFVFLLPFTEVVQYCVPAQKQMTNFAYLFSRKMSLNKSTNDLHNSE